MTTAKQLAPVLAAAGLVAGLGVVHGMYTDRWGPSGQLQQATAVLDRLPPAVGDWVGEDLAYEPEDMARAGIRRCVFRKYTNPRTREVVSVLVVCGRGGPISVHTPDVCYTGAGYALVTDPAPREVTEGGQTHTFRVARFAKSGGVVQSQLEIYWGWSPDGRTWDGPASPRVPFARLPALYKIYVVREFLPGSRAEAADPCRDFLVRAIPEFRTALAPPG